MKRPKVTTLAVALSVCMMGMTALKAHAGALATCGASALGCKEYHSVPNPSGGPTPVRCSFVAGNYKNYVVRAWGCSGTTVTNNTCDEVNSEDDCCISSNSINCSSLTASCPCVED